RIFGHPVGSSAARRRLGYLPEIANYHDFMGVMELLEIHAQLAGVPSTERRKKCQEALEAVDLGHRAASRIRELSKGMQQRFGIAQAIVASPPLLILDEVTSGLDPLGQKEVKDIILRLKGRGITIFFSSHKLTEVENICDVIGIIHRGQMLQCTPLDSFLLADHAVEVRFRGGEAAAALEQDGLVPTAVQDGALLTVQREKVDVVLERIHQAHGSVWSVQPHRRTLEDAFFDLITSKESP
ncbi:MAG: ABC transporter ATP-binding protein, partial [Candidatus Xenobia bacterium]